MIKIKIKSVNDIKEYQVINKKDIRHIINEFIRLVYDNNQVISIYGDTNEEKLIAYSIISTYSIVMNKVINDLEKINK